MKKKRVYSRQTTYASALLGQRIKLGRKKRGWSEGQLAKRAGISRATLQKIEAGEMTTGIGIVFEVAVLTGVDLFEPETSGSKNRLEEAREMNALLPQRIRSTPKVIDDDF